MTTEAELIELLAIHPETNRIAGFGSNTGLVSESGAQAVAVSAELLHPQAKKPSGKWLLLQVQPVDAMILAASILAHAQREGWPIPEDLLEKVEHVRFPAKNEKKH